MLTAFQPQGNTIVLNASSTGASTAGQPSTGGMYGYRAYNMGSVPIYMAWGQTSTVAAVAPTTASPANGVPIAPGAPESFNLGPNMFFSAISTAGVPQLAITAGFGQ